MTDVGKYSIWTLALYFLAYLLLHLLIVWLYMNESKEYSKKLSITQTVDKNLEKKIRILKYCVRWFPAVYVIFLILVLAL